MTSLGCNLSCIRVNRVGWRAAALLLAASPLAAQAEWNPALHVSGSADVESAYICRGYVWDSRPITAQYVEGEFDSDFAGRFQGYVWTASALSCEGHSTNMRHAFFEVDYGLRYWYDIKLADEWVLSSGVGKQWVDNTGVRHNAHSLIDYQAFQTLKNPYLTPYWKLRYIRRPYQAAYWCVGAKHAFELAEKLSFTVDFFGDFGDARHFRHLFGPKPGHEESNYHGGLHALSLVLRLDYAVTDYLGIYCLAGQYCLVSKDAREAVRAADLQESKCDITYCAAGVSFQF